MKRHKALQVLVHVVSMTNALERADHLKGDAVEQNTGADCRAAQEQSAAGFITQNDHAAFLSIVQLIQPAAFVHRQVADLTEHGRNAHDGSAGLVEVAHFANVASPDDRSGRTYAGALAD